MFKKFLILPIFFLIFFTSNPSYANNEILFIDIDYIFTNSSAGKKVNEEIKKKSKIVNDEYKTYKKKTEEKKTKLLNQKKILSNEEFKKQYMTLEKEVNDFNKKISIKNNRLINLKKQIRGEFTKQIKIILQNYAQDNSVQMILNKDRILVGKKDLDITKKILDIFNQNVKIIKVE